VSLATQSSADAEARRESRSLASWGFGAFIVLGVPDGMLGTAWPTMRHTFHQPLSGLGVLLLVGMSGALVTSLSTSIALRKVGAGWVLISAGVIGAVALALIASAPTWWVVLVGGWLVGAAAGLLDTGLNTVVALAGRLRLLNMLHGAYGIGAAIGPLLVTVAIVAGSWRSGYAIAAGFEVVLIGGWWFTRDRWSSIGSSATPVDVSAADLDREPRHVGLLTGLGVVMFFCYTGVEFATGAWSASFLRGQLHVSPGLAGPVVFAYPAALTLGRFATAIPKRSLNASLAVWIGCAGGLLGAGLIWWAPSVAVVVVALALMGLGFAPVFPSLVTLTPVRLGARRAHHVIGWQIAAANVGGAGLSACVGIELQHQGLARLGPSLFVIVALAVACNVALELVSRSPS
jgi:fucose permease